MDKTYVFACIFLNFAFFPLNETYNVIESAFIASMN